jgi:hypothetical protein
VIDGISAAKFALDFSLLIINLLDLADDEAVYAVATAVFGFDTISV